MAEGLKIQVTADVQQANSALKTVVENLDNVGSSAVKSSTALDASLGKSTTALKKVTKQVSIFEGSIETLEARIGARKSFLRTETDITKIRQLNREISLLELQVTQLSNTGRTKYDQFGVAIGRVGQASRTAATQINISSTALSGVAATAQKAFAGLLRLSYLLPGIGFAGLLGGILTVGGALLGIGNNAKKTAVDFSGLDDQLKASQEAQRELAEAANKASAALVGEAKDLSDLRAILQSTTADTNELSQATIKQGVARLIFSQKETELQKALSAEIERQFLLRKRTTELRQPFAGVQEFTVDPTLQRLKNQQKLNREFGTTDLKLDALIKRIEELNSTSAQSGGVLDFLGAMSTGLDDIFKSLVDGKVKPIEIPVRPNLIDTDILNDLGLQLKLLKPIKAQPLVDSIANGVETADFSKITEIVNLQLFNEFNKLFEELGAEIPDIDVTLSPVVNREQLSAALAVIKKTQAEGLAAAQAISGVLTPAFEGLFDAIVKGESPLKAFFQSLGQAVTQLISKLIAAALQALILSAIFPGGIGGAKGFGSIFGKILGFAQGGIVSGPTLALIGEGAGTSRSNPEVVAPLDQLKAMLSDMGGGGSQMVVVTGRLRGNDMILQNSRTSRQQRRLGAG